MTITPLRIAIVGAGASGLTCLKTLIETFARADVQHELQAVVYEQNDEVGGVWYDNGRPKISETVFADDQTAIVQGSEDVSPMYDGLRTNLPHALMSYRDHTFPDDTPLFPTAEQVQLYLESYADRFGLRSRIRFRTPVGRLHKDRETREWIIESRSGEERFDRVVVANGHYADTYIPCIPGLSTFPGSVTHSRFYRSPKPYLGKTVLVVGSFASGSDLARLISSSNLDTHPDGAPPTKVYVSSEGDTSYASRDGEWARWVTDISLIESIDGRHIKDRDGRVVDDVDAIIFATGYHYALPFCKKNDWPWSATPPLPKDEQAETTSNEATDKGLSGFYMDRLDPLQLFLEGDTTIAFPTLQYQIVPFPLAEAQARLIAYHWSDLLSTVPRTPPVPTNPSNPYSHKRRGGENEKQRKVMKMRKDFVFGAPHEWAYEEHLMQLCLSAEHDESRVPACWKGIEQWRRDLRSDKDLRKRTLGY